MATLKLKDENGNWISIQSIKGETGPQGPAGESGSDYVLTEADKQEIAGLVLAELPSSEEVSY